MSSNTIDIEEMQAFFYDAAAIQPVLQIFGNARPSRSLPDIHIRAGKSRAPSVVLKVHWLREIMIAAQVHARIRISIALNPVIGL
jgi:hypothetical protein